MSILSSLWECVKPTLVVWTFGFATMTAIELLAPRERYSLRGRLPGLLFWAIWLAISGVAYAGFRALWSAFGIPPLVTLPTGAGWQTPVTWIVAPIAGAMIYDFFFYWCHRAQHRWLWRYHAVHHSIREMSAVNAFHHPIEPFVQILLIALPTSLIASEAAPAVPAILILLHLQASFIHADSRWHLGPLSRFVVDNRFHRIHHSIETKHFDHNFGAFTTLWDRLFGTAWMPANDEWPETGIAEVDQPRTLHDWVSLPVVYDRAVDAPAPPPSAITI
ncbi:sterol desaturase family protein [uncultured Sphingomonas sp.]|uniref:sterol desaturase family protein n=1 Tax=uncultured Sphingomonas sp. TaxID=158754 RepID=UPI0025DFBBED|nr:sterol desaturase family protein [uncultured Sphingomonas sp.]